MTIETDLNNALNKTKADNFGKMLFDLVLKADPHNTKLLRMGFPQHVSMVEHYRKTGIVEPVQPFHTETLTPEERKGMAELSGLSEEEVSQTMTEIGLDPHRQHINFLAEMIHNILLNQTKKNIDLENCNMILFETLGNAISLMVHNLPLQLVTSVMRSVVDVAKEARDKGMSR